MTIGIVRSSPSIVVNMSASSSSADITFAPTSVEPAPGQEWLLYNISVRPGAAAGTHTLTITGKGGPAGGGLGEVHSIVLPVTIEPEVTATTATGSAPAPTTPSPPTTSASPAPGPIDIRGRWRLTVTVTRELGACSGEAGKPYTEDVTITQKGKALTVVGGLTGGSAWTGSINGQKVGFKGTRGEDGGTTTATFELTLNAGQDRMTGTEAWSWTDGSLSCPNGASTVTARKLS